MKLASIPICLVSLIACSSPASAQTNWPQFRGADSRGVASGNNLPDRWSATENVAWKTDIPGRGWSSPIVWGDRVFVTTVINSGKAEEPKKGLYFGGDRLKPADAVHQWKVLCLDLQTGNVRWERQVHEGKPETPIHLKSSYASETPVTDGERVYCCFGNVGVFCFDLDGQEVWKHALKPQAIRNGWGTAASPVLHRDRLYLVNDNDQDSYLLALDSKTGEQVWRTPRDEKSNWATPFIWQNAQRTEIVTPGTRQVRSYDLDGKLLWSLKGMSNITIAMPYEHKGLLYVSSGYVLDQTKPIYAIRPGATGDISLKGSETSNEFIAWSQPKAGPYNPSTLIYNDRLYVLYDMGLLRCFQANDGQEIFGMQRLPNGRAFTSSPWGYDGKVFCLNEDGATIVLKAGDQFEVLQTNSLAEDDMCMATPAIAGDRLLIRTSARLYCIRKPEAVSGGEAKTPNKGLPPPIAHWKLDEDPDARDSAGSHHGTIHGAVSHAGKFGKALLFDRAKNDHVAIPHSPDFEIGTFTVSAWVWLTKEPTFSGILGTRSGGEFNFDMKVNADKVHGDIGDGSRWIDTAINFYKDDVGSNGQGGDLETKRWYLITFVVDNERKECRLYLDGDRKKAIPFKGEPRLMRPGQIMTIGNTGKGEFMDGVIDDVRIWKQALTDEQVRNLIAP